MATVNTNDNERRIVVIGSPTWTSRALTIAALRRVMRVYQGPYVLVCDMTDGAARYAAVAARELGWTVETHEFDPTKCSADCPPAHHRRSGGPSGEFCPTAKFRNVAAMADSGVDLCLVLSHGVLRSEARRDGSKELRMSGVGVWDYIQPVTRKGGK